MKRPAMAQDGDEVCLESPGSEWDGIISCALGFDHSGPHMFQVNEPGFTLQASWEDPKLCLVPGPSSTCWEPAGHDGRHHGLAIIFGGIETECWWGDQ